VRNKATLVRPQRFRESSRDQEGAQSPIRNSGHISRVNDAVFFETERPALARMPLRPCRPETATHGARDARASNP